MRQKRLYVLLLALAIAFSSTNPHRVSAASVEDVLTLQEVQETDRTVLSEPEVARVTQMALDHIERTQEPDAREVSAYNAILVQMALQEEERRIEESIERKALAQSGASARAQQKLGASGKLRLSQEDLNILYRIVQAEAGDQSLKGRIMVVNVIMNRVRNENFPDTVRGVVFQKSQFSPVGSGSYYKVKPDETTKRAVQAAVNGEDYVEGALYFCTRAIAGRFSRYLTRVTSEGDHVFFK